MIAGRDKDDFCQPKPESSPADPVARRHARLCPGPATHILPATPCRAEHLRRMRPLPAEPPAKGQGRQPRPGIPTCFSICFSSLQQGIRPHPPDRRPAIWRLRARLSRRLRKNLLNRGRDMQIRFDYSAPQGKKKDANDGGPLLRPFSRPNAQPVPAHPERVGAIRVRVHRRSGRQVGGNHTAVGIPRKRIQPVKTVRHARPTDHVTIRDPQVLGNR